MTLPTIVQELLDEGRASVRGALRFQLASGHYGLWLGKWDIYVAAHDLTYWPNTVVSVPELTQVLGSGASEFDIVLPIKRDFGLTPDILGQIENEQYKNGIATIYDFYLHPDSGAFLHAEALAYGYIDTIPHELSSGEYTLTCKVMSGAIDNHRESFRTASHADQQLVSPGDRFLENAYQVRTEYFDIEL